MTPIYQAKVVDKNNKTIRNSIFFFSKEKARKFAETFFDENNYRIDKYWVKE